MHDRCSDSDTGIIAYAVLYFVHVFYVVFYYMICSLVFISTFLLSYSAFKSNLILFKPYYKRNKLLAKKCNL